MGPNLINLACQRAYDIAEPPPHGQPHSLPVPGSKKEGRSAIYRHWRYVDKPIVKTLDESITNCHDMFEQTANKVPRYKCLGHRPYDSATKTFGPYVWETYQEVQRRRANFGAGLVELHREVGVIGQQYGVGLWCQNRPEWQITDLGCMSQGLFTVSIYDTLGPDTTEFIINHAQLTCVVTTLSHIPTLFKIKPRCPSLKLIVCIEPLDAGEQPGSTKADILNALARDQGVRVVDFSAVETLGEAVPRPYNPPRGEDIVTINYTSGTTGDPKGVVLTHANAVSAASASLVSVRQGNQDILCSFLPLAHIYERCGEHTALWAGTAIGYFHGNVQELIDDFKVLRPTVINAVPRLYNRFGGAIKDKTINAPGVMGSLSRHIVDTKLANLKHPDAKGATNKHSIYDRIWAKRVSGALGLDRCRTMVSGSAPLDPTLHQFLRTVFANHFLQGYGLTETYAVTLTQVDGDVSAGNCGAVVPTTEVCLRDLPEMEYSSNDKPFPRGELLIRSTSLFREYYRNEAETKKAVDEDGWFHTGDVCQVDELGRFKIIDRVKNILKLSQGEYVSPERIENVLLANCSFLATGFVHGDSTQSSLVAIFGVQPDLFASFASAVLKRKVDERDLRQVADAAANEQVRAKVVREFEKVAKKSKFNKYEYIRTVRLFVDPFTIENQLLTPT